MTSSRQCVLLDTSILIDLLRRRRESVERLRELTLGGFEMATAAVCIAEVYAGIRKGEESRTEALLSSLGCLPLSRRIAQRAGEITAARRRIGRTHFLDDMMIAATAMEHGCGLWTNNRKDFDLPELDLFPE
jgi:predicted nucleic acid-binding protein